jgi:hypothetical protein
MTPHGFIPVRSRPIPLVVEPPAGKSHPTYKHQRNDPNETLHYPNILARVSPIFGVVGPLFFAPVIASSRL